MPDTLDHLSLLPLGGVGRIGMNAMLLGAHAQPVARPDDPSILLDCGVMFPEDDVFGIDLVLPSLQVLRKYRAGIQAIVITHGHEDHIGALPFVLKELRVPVYATRFTAGLIQHKLREHGLEDEVDLHLISPSRRLQIGPFDLGFLRVTHSIPDCVSLAIRTPLGNLVFTGDFKIEAGLRDGTVFDEAGFRAFGDEGVLLLMSDSTNAEVPGWSGSEAEVARTLDAQFTDRSGRIIATMFASNLYRLHSFVDAAKRHGRRTVLVGRSLHTYLNCGNSFTQMPFDPSDFAKVEDLHRYDDDQLLVICTGSQAEPRSVLARAAAGTHPDLELKPSDTVLLSSRVIPGNERRIHAMLNDLARRGAHVLYHRNCKGIHVSGHAYADEQKRMLELVRPKFFFPVHGEYTFLKRHAELASETGVKRTLVAENGQRLELRPDRVEVRDVVDVAPWYADGQVVGDADALAIRERQRLAWNGVVAVTLALRKHDRHVTGEAEVQVYGVPGEAEIEEEMELALERWLADLDPQLGDDALDQSLRHKVRQVCKRFTTRKPVVMPFVRWRHD
jgi:ribonuclease J